MLLDNYLVGWNEVEPVVLGCVANRLNILFLGKHGCGKSSLARFIGSAFKDSKLTVYHADKENLISAVGIPDPNALKEGKIRYASHDRSMFNADIIVIDELPRATKEGQNMFLEALEERTIFGFPLKYKFLVATGNDETYKANYKLDAALLDRFFCVVPTPTTDKNGFGAEEFKRMVQLNMGQRQLKLNESNENLLKAIKSIEQAYTSFWLDDDIKDGVAEFCGKFFAILMSNLSQTKATNVAIYIPPRVISYQFPRVILAIAAYYKAVRNNQDFLVKGAWDAVQYSLFTKLGIPIEILQKVFDSIKDLLGNRANLINRIKVDMTTGPVLGRLETVKKFHKEIAESMEVCEAINAIGNLMQVIDPNNKDHTMALVELSSVLDQSPIHYTCRYHVKLVLLRTALNM